MIALKSGKKKLHLSFSGSKDKSSKGVAVIVEDGHKADFKPISDRVCLLTIAVKNDYKLHIISTFAATMKTTVQNPEETTKFYNSLTSVLKLTKPKDIVRIGGDFNAKTKLSDNQLQKVYNKTVGKYSIGSINENGQLLLEFAKMNQLKLSNTFYKQKPSHLTTWQGPERT